MTVRGRIAGRPKSGHSAGIGQSGSRTAGERLRAAPQAVAITAAVLVVALTAVITALVSPGGTRTAAHTTAVRTAPKAPARTPGGTAHPGTAGHAPAAPTYPLVPDSIQHAAETPGRAVNITIDDGPDPVWTPRVLAVLAKHHAHATFCMIGPQARANPAVVRQVVAAGDRLCDHTVHHDEAMDKKPVAYQQAEIMDALTMIEQASGGARVSYYRAPGGAFTPASRAFAAHHGMRPLGWNVDTKDYERRGVGTIVRTVKDEIGNGPTILFHDGGGNRSQTVAALDRTLTWLHTQGYAFSFPKVN